MAAELGPRIRAVAEELAGGAALFECSPSILKTVPLAAAWYLKLAGFSQKTLANIRLRPASFGLQIRPGTLALNLQSGRKVREADILAFSQWINTELEELYPRDKRSETLALDTVLLIEGGSILGSVLNEAGNEAVDLLKKLFVAAMEKRLVKVEVQLEDGSWCEYTPELNLLKRRSFRFGGKMVCDLIPGGNHADIRITFNKLVILVGEVKGRKDLSNLWESWVPQIANHFRTWTREHQEAARVFFGTIFTEEMVEGISAAGTSHTGLKNLHSNGYLQAAYNLSNVAANQPAQVAAFEDLVDRLVSLLAPLPSKTVSTQSRKKAPHG